MASLSRQAPLKVSFSFDGWFHSCFALGELDSHTLLFEARHNWTGLLVEPMVNIKCLKYTYMHSTIVLDIVLCQ